MAVPSLTVAGPSCQKGLQTQEAVWQRSLVNRFWDAGFLWGAVTKPAVSHQGWVLTSSIFCRIEPQPFVPSFVSHECFYCAKWGGQALDSGDCD